MLVICEKLLACFMLVTFITISCSAPAKNYDFTSDIEWNKLKGIWYMTMKTDYFLWAKQTSCYIAVPYNISETGMKLYQVGFEGDNFDKPLTMTDHVTFGEGGSAHWNREFVGEWEEESKSDDKKVEMIRNNEADFNEQLALEAEWFYGHVIKYLTNYNVLVVRELTATGKVRMQLLTRTPTIGRDDVKYLTKLAVEKWGVDKKHIKTTECYKVQPNDVLKYMNIY